MFLRMRRVLIVRAVLAATALALTASIAAAPARTQHVEAELVAARTALVPGEPLTVALRLAIDKGWHTYWRNPGDSGLPTTLAWKLPPGVLAGPIEWPTPKALPAGPLVNYGYEGEVLHLVELTTDRTVAPGGSATLNARADWLVCKETCIPEGADLVLTLPVAAGSSPDSHWGTAIAAAKRALPQSLARWKAGAEGKGKTVVLKLEPPSGAADPGEVRFFSYAADRIEPSAPQTLSRDGNAYALTLPVANTLRGNFDRAAGVITAANGFGDDTRAATIDVALAGSVAAGSKPAPAPAPVLNLAPAPPGGEPLTLALAIVSALLGGMILNLMPCVFPVLSLKVLGFATHHDTKPTLRHEAVAFGAGVIATFVALGLLLTALRAAGEQLGWGFQLQSPWVVTALAMLFFVLALNLSGVFEFGQLAPSAVTNWSSKNRTIDAFGSGVLAVVIASPCTAPFMGAALGFAMAGSTSVLLVVFIALGVGMALPYALLAWFPGWRRRQPGNQASNAYGSAMPTPSTMNTTSRTDVEPAIAKPSAAPMNGAVHGEAMTTASTPEPNASIVRFFDDQLVTADGASCPNSNTPERLSASTKNSMASAVTTHGDWSWKPQPNCSPAARSAVSRRPSAMKVAVTPAPNATASWRNVGFVS